MTRARILLAGATLALIAPAADAQQTQKAELSFHPAAPVSGQSMEIRISVPAVNAEEIEALEPCYAGPARYRGSVKRPLPGAPGAASGAVIVLTFDSYSPGRLELESLAYSHRGSPVVLEIGRAHV